LTIRHQLFEIWYGDLKKQRDELQKQLVTLDREMADVQAKAATLNERVGPNKRGPIQVLSKDALRRGIVAAIIVKWRERKQPPDLERVVGYIEANPGILATPYRISRKKATLQKMLERRGLRFNDLLEVARAQLESEHSE